MGRECPCEQAAAGRPAVWRAGSRSRHALEVQRYLPFHNSYYRDLGKIIAEYAEEERLYLTADWVKPLLRRMGTYNVIFRTERFGKI